MTAETPNWHAATEFDGDFRQNIINIIVNRSSVRTETIQRFLNQRLSLAQDPLIREAMRIRKGRPPISLRH